VLGSDFPVLTPPAELALCAKLGDALSAATAAAVAININVLRYFISTSIALAPKIEALENTRSDDRVTETT
jgi:hypothetical protein